MKTALICHDDDHLSRQALPRWMASFSEIVGIVSIAERREQKKNRIKRELRRVGPLRFLDVLAYRVYHRLFVAARDAAYESRLIRHISSNYPSLPSDLPVLTTPSPNSRETREFLETLRPDLVIARCKVILKREIFSIPRLGTYVMHPGICPEYRNAHGCFWALSRRDLGKVGMTLLKIDEGIDTGPVFAFFSYPYDEVAESHIVIQHRTVFENLDRIRDTLAEIEKGTATPIDTRGRPSGNWGQPWLSKYLSWKRAARRRGQHEVHHSSVSRRRWR